MIEFTSHRRVQSCRHGFSLLEVILAAAILSAASMVLYSTFTLGDRQGVDATKICRAQILAQSILDEILAQPSQLEVVEAEPVPGFPDWLYSVQSAPTELDNLVVVTVTVAPNPMPAEAMTVGNTTPSGFTGSRVNSPPDNPSAAGEAEATQGVASPRSERPDPHGFALVRWLYVPSATTHEEELNR